MKPGKKYIKILESNENESSTYQKFCEITMLRRKFIAMNAHVKKNFRDLKYSDSSQNLGKTEASLTLKWQAVKKKNVLKKRTEVNMMETKLIIHRTIQIKIWAFEKMNKINIPIELNQRKTRENTK